MAQIQSSAYAEKSFSDRVIDGLFSGLISGVVMILSMIIGILLYNQDPAGFLANFSFGETPSPLNGLLSVRRSLTNLSGGWWRNSRL